MSSLNARINKVRGAGKTKKQWRTYCKKRQRQARDGIHSCNFFFLVSELSGIFWWITAGAHSVASSYLKRYTEIDVNDDPQNKLYHSIADCHFKKKPFGKHLDDMEDFMDNDIDDMDIVPQFIHDDAKTYKPDGSKKPRSTQKKTKSAQKQNRSSSRKRKREVIDSEVLH